jgi:ribosomal protein S18 acetylase RimI-like enzyme
MPESTLLLQELHMLPWDSNHWGVTVAHLPGPMLTAEELAVTLHQAREDGVRLVYWMAAPNHPVPARILREFDGQLVDHRLLFGAHLERAAKPDGSSVTEDDCRIVPARGAAPSRALLDLAIAAGHCSRFQSDHRFPRSQVRRLYELWMEGSLQGRLADQVLMARSPADVPLGMVTIALHEGRGQIGLIAVAEQARGQGIGAALLRSAANWLLQQQALQVTVVTQQVNHHARRLYQRAGYSLWEKHDVYHFWL